MNAAFFNLEDWEQDFLRDRLGSNDCQFFADSLDLSLLHEPDQVEVLGVFIYSKVTEELLQKLPSLRLIVTYSTGFDHIDVKACRERNIQVCNVPTYGENTVAEHTFALLLNLTRKLHKSYLKTLQGDFSLDGLRGTDLKGKTLGIVGLGHIGQHVARIAKGFEMEVIAHDPKVDENISEVLSVEMCEYEQLLSRSDVLSFHCPLNEQTRHLFHRGSLQYCKKGVYLVNTARGAVIETEALLEGLDKGVLAGVGLDVVEEEQCFIREEKELLSSQFDSECMKITLENHALLHHPKVLISPHNAFNSVEALQRIFTTTVENIQLFEKGKVLNGVIV